jgi:tetratricopeptide (TPR) repeat protein
MYLPLAPLSVLAVLGLRGLAIRAQVSRQVLAGAVAGLAIALGILTYRRNEVYESGTRVWVDVIEKAPRNARAFFNLAWHVEEQPGGIPTAIKLYRRAIELNPALAAAHRSLAVLLFTSDRQQAVWHARQAVGLERSADNLSNLGIVIAEEDPREAEACFREALTLSPSMAEAKANLAKLLASKRATEAAIEVEVEEREPALASP